MITHFPPRILQYAHQRLLVTCHEKKYGVERLNFVCTSNNKNKKNVKKTVNVRIK